jgi:DNA polymerase III epsilon subunit-like protein
MIEHFIAIDTETGGLDASECALLSIAAVPSWGARPFSIAVLPNGVIEPKAAEVNGYTPERWAELGAVSEKVAALELRRWLEDMDRHRWHMAAHNAGFDSLFLRALEARTGIDLDLPGIWHCTQIKLQGLRSEGILPPGSNRLDDLGAVSGFWDLEPRAAQHDALQDARCCAHGLAWIREKKKGGRP